MPPAHRKIVRSFEKQQSPPPPVCFNQLLTLHLLQLFSFSSKSGLHRCCLVHPGLSLSVSVLAWGRGEGAFLLGSGRERSGGGPSGVVVVVVVVQQQQEKLGSILLGFLALVVIEVEPALLNDGSDPLLVLPPVFLVQLCCQAVRRAVRIWLVQERLNGREDGRHIIRGAPPVLKNV